MPQNLNNLITATVTFFNEQGNTRAARSVKYAANIAEVKSFIVGQLGPEQALKAIAKVVKDAESIKPLIDTRTNLSNPLGLPKVYWVLNI